MLVAALAMSGQSALVRTRTAATRRAVSAWGAAAALLPPLPALPEVTNEPLRIQTLTAEQLDALKATSRDDPGVMLPSGVRVIDLVVGDGPRPRKGAPVWVSFKCWTGGFDAGQAADLSFLDGRPYDWILGQPTDRIPPGVDEAVASMREGGWRRLVVPAAVGFGDKGLRKTGRSIGGFSNRSDKAGFAVKPGADVFFDLRLIDGGSGRCTDLLRPLGMSDAEARRRKSLGCLPSDLKVALTGGETRF